MGDFKAYSSVDYAYETIKGWILSGYLTPGSKLDQDGAAEKMQISRTPIRHALERLDAEGLVINTPHRGAVVTPISEEDLNNVYDIRAQLEAMALIQAMPHITETSIVNLRAVLATQKAVGDPNINIVMEQNRSFHRSIVVLCDNHALISIIDGIWEQCERYRRIYYQVPGSNERIIREHSQLVELIAAGKTQDASDFLIEHTRQSQRRLLAYFSKDIAPLMFKPLILD